MSSCVPSGLTCIAPSVISVAGLTATLATASRPTPVTVRVPLPPANKPSGDSVYAAEPNNTPTSGDGWNTFIFAGVVGTTGVSSTTPTIGVYGVTEVVAGGTAIVSFTSPTIEDVSGP